MKKTFFICLLSLGTLCASPKLFAQTDSTSLLSELETETDKEIGKIPVNATFKSTYVVSAPSVETVSKGVLNFMIMHRFGKINDGAYEFFGLDNAAIRLGFDYGITDDLNIGIGRSSTLKTFDGSIKYKFLKQTTDNRMPLTATLYTGLTYETQKYDSRPKFDGVNRGVYFTQLLLARKFNEAFSVQLTPTWIHYNLVPTTADANDVFAGTIGVRYKLTNRTSINVEYTLLPDEQIMSSLRRNALSVGFDIETGGHVFQLMLSNAQGMNVPSYVAGTTQTWKDGGIFFGFNVSRVFNIARK